MITDEEKLLKDRIKYLIVQKKISISRIADNDNERILLGRQINGGDTIVSYRTIYKLLYMFHDVSADWLVMGEGGMYKPEHTAPRVYTQHNEVHDNTAGGDITVGGSKSQGIPSQKEIDAMRSRIYELESDKRTLQAVVDALTAGARKK